MLDSLMYKLSYYDFGNIMLDPQKPTGNMMRTITSVLVDSHWHTTGCPGPLRTDNNI